MLSPERLFFLFIVALVVQPCISRITLPLRVSTIAKSLASSCGLGVGVDGSVIVSACYGCCIYKVMPSGPTTVVAGVLGACGFADGNGSKARFSSPVGVAIDADRNLAYIADAANNRIRVVDLSTYAVNTVAGSSAGFRDGAFSAALFNYCFGLVLRTSTSQKVLYIADYSNGRIRKANFSSMMVSTVAVVPLPTFLDMLNDDQRLFVSSDNGAIYQILLANNNSAMILAGSAGVSGYVDAVGTAARFSQPRGVALSHDNAALFVGDLNNVRLPLTDPF